MAGSRERARSISWADRSSTTRGPAGRQPRTAGTHGSETPDRSGSTVALNTVDARGRRALNQVFAELPTAVGPALEGESLVELSDVLNEEDLRAIVLTDTGTRGLGGPT